MDPVRPDYQGACIRNAVGAVRGGAEWAPPAVADADGVVLLVLDGFPWTVLDERRADLPNLGAMVGGPITSVVPSTTPTALLSITTFLTPAEHGVVGYRMLWDGHLFNILRWTMPGGGVTPDPFDVQPREAFGGEPLPVVTRSAFRTTKFTEVQLRGVDFRGWFSTSSLVEHCRAARGEGERFVYAYYDGLDLVAHMHGMRGRFFDAEVAFCDALVGDLLDALDPGTALVVTADHGHVHFDRKVSLDSPLIAHRSGESRFRYLHARSGAAEDLAEEMREVASGHSWVFTRDQLIDEGWLGGTPSPAVRRRIGDVVVAAREPVSFHDPDNPGEGRLLSGHGSLTPDEMLVPFVGARGRRQGA